MLLLILNAALFYFMVMQNSNYFESVETVEMITTVLFVIATTFFEISVIELFTKKRKWVTMIKIIVGAILVVILFGYAKYLSVKVNLNEQELNVNHQVYEELNVKKQDIINVCVIGSDTRSVDVSSNGRSDALMILSINLNTKTIKIISIPRDTYVAVEGHGSTKITNVYSYGKEQLLLKTINQNFGLDITQYVSVNFFGLAKIINDIGGIELTISEEERQFINKRLPEIHKITGTKKVLVSKAGSVLLNGEQALAHARNRTTGGSDFVRQERQRTVIETLIKKISQKSQVEILQILNNALPYVRTNISVEKYTSQLAELLMDKNTYLNSIISKQIPDADHATGKNINGTYYYVPTDLQTTSELFKEYLYVK